MQKKKLKHSAPRYFSKIRLVLGTMFDFPPHCIFANFSLRQLGTRQRNRAKEMRAQLRGVYQEDPPKVKGKASLRHTSLEEIDFNTRQIQRRVKRSSLCIP